MIEATDPIVSRTTGRNGVVAELHAQRAGAGAEAMRRQIRHCPAPRWSSSHVPPTPGVSGGPLKPTMSAGSPHWLQRSFGSTSAQVRPGGSYGIRSATSRRCRRQCPAHCTMRCHSAAGAAKSATAWRMATRPRRMGAGSSSIIQNSPAQQLWTKVRLRGGHPASTRSLQTCETTAARAPSGSQCGELTDVQIS